MSFSATFLRAALLAFLVGSAGLLVFKMQPLVEAYRINDWIERKLDLASGLPSPKIVFLGGSSTWFGLNAVIVESETGLTTFNFGLHGGMNQRYAVQIGLTVTKPGDIAVWSPEYQSIQTERENRLEGPIRRLRGDWKSNPETLFGLFVEPLAVTERGRGKRVSAPYDVGSIGLRGDQVSDKGREAGDLCHHLNGSVLDEPYMDEILSDIRSVGVVPIVRFPSIADLDCNKAVEAFAEQLANWARQRDVRVIGSFGESLLPPPAFLDTNYHLTRSAAAQCSMRLAQLIDNLVKEQR